MRNIFPGLLAAALVIAPFQMAFAQSTDYQMLPPTFASGSPSAGQPCTANSTGQNQVLFFSGASTGAINCLSNGFTINPTNGFIGIGGVTTPSATLTLLADSPVTTTAEWSPNIFRITTGINEQSLYMSYDSQANLGFIEASQAGFSTPLLLQPRASTVGIGITTAPQATLDVNGETKIGSTGVACTSANEGAIRYNTSIHAFEGCNGTQWGSLFGTTRTWHGTGLPAGVQSGSGFTSTCSSATQNNHNDEMVISVLAYSHGAGAGTITISAGPDCGSLTFVGGGSLNAIFAQDMVASGQGAIPKDWYWQIQTTYSGSVGLPVLMEFY